MDTKNFRVLGVVLIVAASLLYSIERAAAIIARGHEFAAYVMINRAVPNTQLPSFWDNGFVSVLAVGGVLLFAYSFARKQT